MRVILSICLLLHFNFESSLLVYLITYIMWWNRIYYYVILYILNYNIIKSVRMERIKKQLQSKLTNEPNYTAYNNSNHTV